MIKKKTIKTTSPQTATRINAHYFPASSPRQSSCDEANAQQVPLGIGVAAGGLAVTDGSPADKANEGGGRSNRN